MAYALVTGPITGRIPIDHAAFPQGHVDVTSPVLLFDSTDEVEAVAAAIDDEHRIRGTHPELETGAV